MKTINENGTFRKRSPEWNFLKTLTWDQAQFERFSYILSNGYRWKKKFRFAYARRNVIYKLKRNENRAWSQVMKTLF